MKIGLTLGRYAHLHGHQYVIDTVLSEMDSVIVLIYDTPEVSEIALHARTTWLEKLYPQVQVTRPVEAPKKQVALKKSCWHKKQLSLSS